MKDTAFSALDSLKIELPSWGFADTGTRFGKFLQDGAAIDTNDKFADAGQVNEFTGCCPQVAVHVLWDFDPEQDPKEVADLAAKYGVRIGSINTNTFQDQIYKLGSFANPDPSVRQSALKHCLDSIQLGQEIGSRLVTYWMADGTNYPGQDSIRARKHRFEENLKKSHDALAKDQILLVEYKPFEPAFYHTDIADWGMSYLYCKKAGPQAKVLVDTGHHYLAQNIEQVVAWLLDEEMLGGFHFNDRRYADDDLTMGSIDPYQIFRIFVEIHGYGFDRDGELPEIAYMVDQSHNLKPKIDAMLQTVMVAQELYLKAALVDFARLRKHQEQGNIIDGERVLQDAFRRDVTPLLGEWRKAHGLAEDPLEAFRAGGYWTRVSDERKARREAMGIKSVSSYA